MKYFGEGLPRGMKKEFEITSVSAVMIRPRLLHLCNQLQRCVTDTMAFDLSAEDMIGKFCIGMWKTELCSLAFYFDRLSKDDFDFYKCFMRELM